MNSLFNQLTERLQQFCAGEGLPQQSADELIHEDITPTQRAWLSSFILQWEEAEQIAESEHRAHAAAEAEEWLARPAESYLPGPTL